MHEVASFVPCCGNGHPLPRMPLTLLTCPPYQYDQEGQIAMEAVQLVADLVKKRQCRAPPDLVWALLKVKVNEVSNPARSLSINRLDAIIHVRRLIPLLGYFILTSHSSPPSQIIFWATEFDGRAPHEAPVSREELERLKEAAKGGKIKKLKKKKGKTDEEKQLEKDFREVGVGPRIICLGSLTILRPLAALKTQFIDK
eukprot:scaffold28262_cov20-Prasinocladus_malaysianus.AAC.1